MPRPGSLKEFEDVEMQELEKFDRGWRCLEAEDWRGKGLSWAGAPQKKKKKKKKKKKEEEEEENGSRSGLF